MTLTCGNQVPGADMTRQLGDCVGPAGYDFDCGGGGKQKSKGGGTSRHFKELGPVARGLEE